jgi:FkbM family methyltransferase
MSFGALKRLSLSIGLYRPARAVHRAIFGAQAFREHRALLSEFLKPGDLAFDVGANIGEKTDIMISLGARVVAFEPQPILARETKARGATVIQAALGAKPTVADLFLTDSSGMASLQRGWMDATQTGKLTVPVTTLDIEIAKHGLPAFCKIDVEGHEVEVLKGLTEPIKALSFEYHLHEAGLEAVRQCLGLLRRLGTYEFNLIGTEGSRWLSDKWMGDTEFQKSFPSCARDHFYGDIFARRSAAGSVDNHSN